MTQPPGPNRSQSSTSLSRLYNGPNSLGRAEDNDPALDFCNSFWGPGDKGYEVLMARLRGASRTVDEIRAFWKERIAIEEEYAKKLNKLSKTVMGRDEIGDLQGCLKHVLNETGQQATYHASLGQELRESVEGPTVEFGNRLANLKKGLQGSVEKAYKNKGLQEGHVNKAKERYESDCLKLNSYTANLNLVQGKELERIQQKLAKVQQTIGANEQDFRQFVRVTEGTVMKWEGEWKSFCDHVQDLEEDRLAMTKDIIWAYANAVSQVCVEDDGSCERIREKLEQFEPQNDMVTFVRGWGTGDSIPDPPKFINYAAGEVYSTHPTSHPARFERISSKPPGSVAPHQEYQAPPEPEPEPIREERNIAPPIAPPNGDPQTGMPNMRNLNISEPPRTASPEPQQQQQPPQQTQRPFGGVALPGMAAPPTPSQSLPDRRSSMGPPALPSSTMTMPEPRAPSRQSQIASNVNDEEDPMVRALANLRKEPPPPDSIRRNPSHRRPESIYSNQGSMRNNINPPASPGPGSFRGAPSPGPGQFKSPSSPAPGQSNNRSSYQQQSSTRQSVDMGLSPPPGGHTAAALAQSMDQFHRQSSRDNRQSVNYSSFADDVVGTHPSSRPSSPQPQTAPRAPSPAMMQAPRQPETHIADEVLSQYHQAFPGERQSRSRAGSRAGSIRSGRSRAGSVNTQAPPAVGQQPPPSPGREGFAGIGAGGGRSPSPQPGAFRSPSPSPQVAQGSLGPQNLGISLDEQGGVAHDSMAEAYRRQYQQSQQGGPGPQGVQAQGSGFGGPARPTSAYGSQAGHGGQGGYGQQQPPQSPYGAQQPPGPNQFQRSASPAPGANQFQRSASPAPGLQQQSSQYFPAYSPVQAQQPQQPQQQQAPQQQQPPPGPAHWQQPSQHSVSSSRHGQQQSYSSQSGQGYAPSPQQPQYTGYQQQPPVQQPPPPQQQYNAPPQNQYARAASPAPHHQQQGSQNYGYRAPSPQPQQQYQPPVGQQQQQPQQQQMRGRTPSPQPGVAPQNAAPTGQWSTSGLPVLFYVKALYDYQAQSAAEFDFQAGDIIAVTNTPEDGWWSGELLDEARRQAGRTDFPSNFVCLF